MSRYEIEAYATATGKVPFEIWVTLSQRCESQAGDLRPGIRDELLRDPENAAFYLEQILEGGNIELFQEALRTVAKAQQGGVKAVAQQANVSRRTYMMRSRPRENRSWKPSTKRWLPWV